MRGKGDPYAEIKIDEQSLVFTAAYARDHGIWPRPAPTPPQPPQPPVAPPVGAGPARATGESRTPSIVAEDVLKAALTQVFERAAQKGVTAFVRMSIRPFDKSDALKLLPAGQVGAQRDQAHRARPARSRPRAAPKPT